MTDEEKYKFLTEKTKELLEHPFEYIIQSALCFCMGEPIDPFGIHGMILHFPIEFEGNEFIINTGYSITPVIKDKENDSE